MPQVADENNGPGGERANRVKFLLRDWDSKFTAAWDSRRCRDIGARHKRPAKDRHSEGPGLFRQPHPS